MSTVGRSYGTADGPGRVFLNPRIFGGGYVSFYQFVIPVQSIADAPRPRLESIYILYSTTENTVINRIVTFDGPRSIGILDFPNGLSGKHDGTGGMSDIIENTTKFNITGNTEILFGIGISVRVAFGSAGEQIKFTSAGASFV